MTSIAATIANEINVRDNQVEQALKLLAEGNTVPFIARYRKEATGGLDDAQLRHIEERNTYLLELAERKQAVLESIGEQGKLTDELKREILAADTKARVEDLYLPYKKRRKTKADIAREAGLEPLADALLTDPTHIPRTAAGSYAGEVVGWLAAVLRSIVTGGVALFDVLTLLFITPIVAFYLLLDGRLKVSQVTPDGQQVMVGILHPGDMFGLDSAFAGSNHSGTAHSAVDSIVVSWSMADWATVKKAQKV